MNTSNSNPNAKPEASKLNGTLNQAAGNVKDAAGKILNNKQMQTEGKVQAVDGKTEKTIANLKEAAKTGAHVAGDAIERVGDKLAQAGMEKLGAAVRNAGDKIEHSVD